MSDTTTASTGNMRPVTVEEMRRALIELELVPMPTEWILLSPNGQLWKGRPEELLKVLIPHHPLLKPAFGDSHD